MGDLDWKSLHIQGSTSLTQSQIVFCCINFQHSQQKQKLIHEFWVDFLLGSSFCCKFDKITFERFQKLCWEDRLSMVVNYGDIVEPKWNKAIKESGNKSFSTNFSDEILLSTCRFGNKLLNSMRPITFEKILSVASIVGIIKRLWMTQTMNTNWGIENIRTGDGQKFGKREVRGIKRQGWVKTEDISVNVNAIASCC